jgi:hypothetical protein
MKISWKSLKNIFFSRQERVGADYFFKYFTGAFLSEQIGLTSLF